jgi:hypothetical protein
VTARPGDAAAPAGPPARGRVVCLYDNAGEHFRPGMDSAAAPGTQHLARSRLLMFLFDPTQNPRFRDRCRAFSTDPQLAGAARLTRQELILTEAAQRVRRYTGLPHDRRHDRPLVVVLTKSDVWAPLVGGQLREPIVPAPAGNGSTGGGPPAAAAAGRPSRWTGSSGCRPPCGRCSWPTPRSS